MFGTSVSKNFTLRSNEAIVGTADISPKGRTASRNSNSISSTNLEAAFKSFIIKALLSLIVLGDNLTANFSGSRYRAASAVNLSNESIASSNCLDKSFTAWSTALNCLAFKTLFAAPITLFLLFLIKFLLIVGIASVTNLLPYANVALRIGSNQDCFGIYNGRASTSIVQYLLNVS